MASAINLQNCSVYFDGCNTCKVNTDGTLAACTKRLCDTIETPKCINGQKKLKKDYMKKMLDDMQIHFSGPGSHFDNEFYDRLQTCMGKFDDLILQESQNNAWKGMLDYFESDGTQNDYMGRTDKWGGCTPHSSDPRCPVGDYQEDTSVVWNKEGMIIYEPCNYASNIAYYHSALRVCDYPDWSVDNDHQLALKRAFFTHAMGSAFWHGSHTYVGYSFDNNMIAMIAYLAYQAAVSELPGTSSILKELSPTPRNKTGQEVSEQLVVMF